MYVSRVYTLSLSRQTTLQSIDNKYEQSQHFRQVWNECFLLCPLHYDEVKTRKVLSKCLTFYMDSSHFRPQQETFLETSYYGNNKYLLQSSLCYSVTVHIDSFRICSLPLTLLIISLYHMLFLYICRIIINV